MSEVEILQSFKSLIENHCGMMITDVHLSQMQKYLTETNEKTGLSYAELYTSATKDPTQLIKLINAVVVNETYFFREEKQFAFLKDYIQENFSGKTVVMWSAACSTGEEPYSLASLALSCNAIPIVYATDIDTEALSHLKNGIYGENSFRPDGSQFKSCILPYISQLPDKSGHNIYAVQPELKEKVLAGRANLMKLSESTSVPQAETVDIIFIRNVFIYFNKQNRIEILRNLTKKLRPGGLLFFSISEIGSMEPEAEGIPLKKQNKNSIFYFKKETKTLKDTFAAKTDKKSADNLLASSTKEAFLAKLRQEKENSKQNLNVAAKITTPVTPVIKKTDADSSPQSLWKKLVKCIEEKEFSKGQQLLDSFSPQVNLLYYKYYFQGFLNSVAEKKREAIEYYEKAGMYNPDFWPAHFQQAKLLENEKDASKKKKRYTALVKTATILEEKKSECEQFTWLFGAFSSSYFYRLCNEYLKREFS